MGAVETTRFGLACHGSHCISTVCDAGADILDAGVCGIPQKGLPDSAIDVTRFTAARLDTNPSQVYLDYICRDQNHCNIQNLLAVGWLED